MDFIFEDGTQMTIDLELVIDESKKIGVMLNIICYDDNFNVLAEQRKGVEFNSDVVKFMEKAGYKIKE